MGTLVDRVHRELTDEDVAKIAGTYHTWRGDPQAVRPEPVEGLAQYQDIPGFCKAAKLDDIRKHGHVLTPGRYVGAEEIEDDGVPFDEKMARFAAELNEQFAESDKLEKAIRKNLKGLGYEPTQQEK
jgi:type I restriction enzyme M protein